MKKLTKENGLGLAKVRAEGYTVNYDGGPSVLGNKLAPSTYPNKRDWYESPVEDLALELSEQFNISYVDLEAFLLLKLKGN